MITKEVLDVIKTACEQVAKSGYVFVGQCGKNNCITLDPKLILLLLAEYQKLIAEKWQN